MRRIIFNADDFGLTPGVTRAIVEAAAIGVLKSATLMANGSAFDQAVASAHSSQLSIGCHLVLIDGKPVSPPDQVPTLLAKQGANFHRTLAPFILRAVAGQFEPQQLEAEATAQIKKLQSAGIPVSHLDTHKHTHLLPQILHPVLRAAQAAGVRAIRNPFEPVRFSAFGGRPRLWKRYLQLLLLSGRAASFRRAVAQAGMITPDGTLAIAATGSLDMDLFHQILNHLPDGTWEFVCHPGYNDADLQRAGTRLLASREQELALLTSPETRQLIHHQNIELISYRDLASQPLK